jgi:GTP cyclohydrolase II
VTACPVRMAETRLPTRFGDFRAVGHRDTDGGEHMALVRGELGDGQEVLVRVHSECLTGDVLGSRRCDCGPQLEAALESVAAEDKGYQAAQAALATAHELHDVRATGRAPGRHPARRRPKDQ